MRCFVRFQAGVFSLDRDRELEEALTLLTPSVNSCFVFHLVRSVALQESIERQPRGWKSHFLVHRTPVFEMEMFSFFLGGFRIHSMLEQAVTDQKKPLDVGCSWGVRVIYGDIW